MLFFQIVFINHHTFVKHIIYVLKPLNGIFRVCPYNVLLQNMHFDFKPITSNTESKSHLHNDSLAKKEFHVLKILGNFGLPLNT